MNDREHDGKTGSEFHPSRRDFLTRAGLLAGGMAFMGVPALRPQQAAAAFAAPLRQVRPLLNWMANSSTFSNRWRADFPKSDVIHEPVGPNILSKSTSGSRSIKTSPFNAIRRCRNRSSTGLPPR